MEENTITPPAAQDAEQLEEALIEQARILREKLAKLQSEGKNQY